MDAELRQVLTVLITVVGTSASTILGLVFANRWAAARAQMELGERERQRRDEVAEQRRQWLSDHILAPLEDEKRKAHAELCAILWVQRRAEAEEGFTPGCEFPLVPTADEVRRASHCLAHVKPGLARRIAIWAEATHWGMYESPQQKEERLQLIGELSYDLDPNTSIDRLRVLTATLDDSDG